MPNRVDDLIIGQQFFATLLFDKDGYYTTIVGLCRDSVVSKAYHKTRAIKSLIACSTVFEGVWRDGIPDVSLPPDHQTELASIDKGCSED